MADQAIDLSEAITLYLKHYPGKNDAEFETRYGSELATAAKENVQSILQEAMKVEPDWSRLSLNEAGDFVESVMRDRHPELSKEALTAIGNYYTYLMR
jgi:hypothetical protein